MVRHIVCQKFRDFADSHEAAKMLRALVGVVPSLKSMEVGVDEKRSERSYDLVLIATFDDWEGLKAYDVHPAHEEVRAFIKARREATVSVDYEI